MLDADADSRFNRMTVMQDAISEEAEGLRVIQTVVLLTDTLAAGSSSH